MRPYPPRMWRDPDVVRSGSQWGWGFNTLRGGIDPGDLRFRLWDVGVVEIWKDFKSGDETQSCPGVAGPRHYPGKQLSPRAGSMSPSYLATSQLGWGLHTLRGGIDPGDRHIAISVSGLLELWRCVGTYHPGMKLYPPWVRRDLDVA